MKSTIKIVEFDPRSVDDHSSFHAFDIIEVER